MKLGDMKIYEYMNHRLTKETSKIDKSVLPYELRQSHLLEAFYAVVTEAARKLRIRTCPDVMQCLDVFVAHKGKFPDYPNEYYQL